MKILFALLSVLSWNTTTQATEVYITNNTDKTLYIDTVQIGGQLNKGDEWNQENTYVPPYSTLTVTRMNRSQGLKSGENYYFNSHITASDGSELVLKQHIQGTWIASNIQASFSSNDFSMPWYNDRNIHQQQTIFQNNNTTVKLKFESNGLGYDNLHYVIQPDHVIQPLNNNSSNLNVISYNIFGILNPFGIASSPLVSERFSLIPPYLVGNDVVIFSEVFHNGEREKLKQLMIDHGFKYYSNVVSDSFSFAFPPPVEDGGVIIFSRWPIINGQGKGEQTIYKNCSGTDCLSTKGAMYTQILKNDKVYHVIGTHTQAWGGNYYHQIRLNQLTQARELIESKNIPASEPVIYAGDLNVDRHSFSGREYREMVNTLQVKFPSSYTGHPYTYDVKTNKLATEGQEYLDYILMSENHLQPYNNINDVQIYRSADNPLWGTWDLSDHYAVQSKLQF